MVKEKSPHGPETPRGQTKPDLNPPQAYPKSSDQPAPQGVGPAVDRWEKVVARECARWAGCTSTGYQIEGQQEIDHLRYKAMKAEIDYLRVLARRAAYRLKYASGMYIDAGMYGTSSDVIALAAELLAAVGEADDE